MIDKSNYFWSFSFFIYITGFAHLSSSTGFISLDIVNKHIKSNKG